jgi:hypothetical protein
MKRIAGKAGTVTTANNPTAAATAPSSWSWENAAIALWKESVFKRKAQGLNDESIRGEVNKWNVKKLPPGVTAHQYSSVVIDALKKDPILCCTEGVFRHTCYEVKQPCSLCYAEGAKQAGTTPDGGAFSGGALNTGGVVPAGTIPSAASSLTVSAAGVPGGDPRPTLVPEEDSDETVTSMTATKQHHIGKTDETHQTHHQEKVVPSAKQQVVNSDAGAPLASSKAKVPAQSQCTKRTASRLGQVTVGTYNILHPEYAESYREPEGVGSTSRKSNWNTRAPAIGRILQEGELDVMFLQEVGQEQLADLEPYLVEYDFKASHVVHPGRSARDGVVVLTKKGRFKVTSTHPVAFEGKLPEDRGHCYMYAAAVVAHDLHNNTRLLLASVHFYKKKCIDPQGTLLTYLAKAQVQHACDYVVWGGDCNTDYPEKVVKYSGKALFGGQGFSKGDEFKTAEGGGGGYSFTFLLL